MSNIGEYIMYHSRVYCWKMHSLLALFVKTAFFISFILSEAEAEFKQTLEHSDFDKCYHWGWNAYGYNNSMNYHDQYLLLPISGLK